MATINAINSNIPIEVSKGGTAAVTLTGVLTGNGTSAVTANAITQHGILIAGASNAVSSLGVAATGTVLTGVTGADAAFSATPTVTSITLGAGSALSTYTDWQSWTPTLVGGTVAGTTSYTTQFGQYLQLGNTVIVMWNINATPGGTATGNLTIGNLPLTVSGTTSYIPYGIVTINAAGVAWPALTTSLAARGAPGGTTIAIEACGSATASGFIAVANAVTVTKGTLIYHV